MRRDPLATPDYRVNNHEYQAVRLHSLAERIPAHDLTHDFVRQSDNLPDIERASQLGVDNISQCRNSTTTGNGAL